MDEDKKLSNPDKKVVVLGKREQSVSESISGGESLKYTRVAMAAMGSIPWVGSVIAAAATLSSENDQSKTNKFIYLWVREHEEKLKELGITLENIFERFESFGDRIKERIESKEYLTLVRKTFRVWDQAETLEKKDMLKKLITNAGGVSISRDDLVRMFLDWIEKYHEFHFSVIREIYSNPGVTRGAIWERIRGEIPREDSAEADLFKLLIRDLSTGGVIRQEREVDYTGNFIKRSTGKNRSSQSSTLESAFEDTKPYVLTELGKELVHYIMEDLAPQIEN